MKMIKILSVLLLLFQVQYTTARQQISLEEAQKVAIQSMKSNPNDKMRISSFNRINQVNTLQAKTTDTLMYEMIFDNGQAILLSGSKACKPILGYFELSEGKSIFDDDIPDGMKAMIKEYEEQIELSFKNVNTSLYYQSEWQKLQTESLTRAATAPGVIQVEPLIKSSWGQHKSNDGGDINAYNYYVTATCSTRNCSAGCVAVAMAQIMNFWKYPIYKQILSAEVPAFLGFFSSGKFAGAIGFDWCNMPDELISTSPNYIKERDAVAYLISECGKKCNMKYCKSGCSSTSELGNARQALINYGYSSNADFKYKPLNLEKEKWKELLKENLDNRRPVLYAGGSLSGAHTFICDGYDSDDYFHFNWGWADTTYAAWFTVDYIAPGSNYKSNQCAVFNLYPAEQASHCDFNLSLTKHFSSNYSLLIAYAACGYAVTDEMLSNLLKNFPKYATTLTSVDPEAEVSYALFCLQGGVNKKVPANWYTISEGETMEYVAHEKITLINGFHAKAGSNFTARLEPCVDCNNTRSMARQFVDDVILTENVLTSKLNSELISSEYTPIQSNGNITIYPNPNQGDFTVNIPNELAENAALEIFNLNGQLLQKIIIQDNKQQVTFKNIPGTYVIKILNGTEFHISKFILE